MPFYEIHHSYPLSPTQRSQIANGITQLHAQTFTTPTLFVHVKFFHENAQTDPDSTIYIGSRPRHPNYIHAHIRPSVSRPKALLDSLNPKVSKIWDEAVAIGGVKVDKDLEGGKKGDWEEGLHAVFWMGDIVAGMEEGVDLPEAGRDKEWLRDNWKEFMGRARREGGHGGMWSDMVGEVKERGLLDRRTNPMSY